MVKALLGTLATRLRHEPVAVWGVVLAAVLTAAPAAGVPAHDVDLIATVLTVVGVPVVRRKVTPLAALRALINGSATPLRRPSR